MASSPAAHYLVGMCQQDKELELLPLFQNNIRLELYSQLESSFQQCSSNPGHKVQ